MKVRPLIKNLKNPAPGRRYQVERAATLGAQVSWQAIGEQITAMGGSVVADLPPQGLGNAFYRVILIPE